MSTESLTKPFKFGRDALAGVGVYLISVQIASALLSHPQPAKTNAVFAPRHAATITTDQYGNEIVIDDEGAR